MTAAPMSSHVSLAGPDTLKVEGCMGALCGGENWTRRASLPGALNALESNHR